MNIENFCKPDSTLIAAVEDVKERELKLSVLLGRRDKQNGVIADLANRLDDLIASRQWEAANSQQDAKKAKQECSDVAERLQDERELLAAINAAIRNSRQEVALANHRVEILTNTIVKEAALQDEPQVKNNLVGAMKEFFACHLAREGARSIGVAQNELEILAQDYTLVKGVERQISSIHQSLRDSVAA